MAKKYIKQAELAEYREANVPISCPLLGNVEFAPVVDHDHKTGKIRGVVSLEGNALLGKIENFYKSRCANSVDLLPTVLRDMANYLEDPQGPYHPVGVRQVTKRFGRASKADQVKMLLELQADKGEVDACKNSKERTKLYRKLLIS